jgi:hypothetical protein
MTVTNWLMIIGWLVTFILAYVLQKLIRSRRLLAWSNLGEANLLTKDDSDKHGVKILIDGEKESSLTVVKYRIGSVGNEVIENIEVVAQVNAGAKILRSQVLSDLGEFSKYISVSHCLDNNLIKLDFINPNRNIDFELLVSNYNPGSLNLDLAAKGVDFLKKESSFWDSKIPSTLLGGFTLSIFGVKYDPTVSVLKEIAEQLRIINFRKSVTNIKIDSAKDVKISKVESD